MELLKAGSMADNREALATGRLESGWLRGRPSTEKDKSAARKVSAFTALRINPTAGSNGNRARQRRNIQFEHALSQKNYPHTSNDQFGNGL